MHNDGWVEWKGGKCPLPDGIKHEIKLLSGKTYQDDSPETWGWGHDGSLLDIIAYRIIEPEQPKEVDSKLIGFLHPDDKPKEPEPTFPLIPYGVYKGSEYLGRVLIQDRPGMKREHRIAGALTYLGEQEICISNPWEINLHRIQLSYGWRKGRLLEC